jgi:hypothetical protein
LAFTLATVLSLLNVYPLFNGSTLDRFLCYSNWCIFTASITPAEQKMDLIAEKKYFENFLYLILWQFDFLFVTSSSLRTSIFSFKFFDFFQTFFSPPVTSVKTWPVLRCKTFFSFSQFFSNFFQFEPRYKSSLKWLRVSCVHNFKN